MVSIMSAGSNDEKTVMEVGILKNVRQGLMHLRQLRAPAALYALFIKLTVPILWKFTNC